MGVGNLSMGVHAPTLALVGLVASNNPPKPPAPLLAPPPAPPLLTRESCNALMVRRANEACRATMSDVSILLARLHLGIPFAFVHFNDGELGAAMKTTGRASNGKQHYSPELRTAVRKAMNTTSPNLYMGLPCPNEFRLHHANALWLAKNTEEARRTSATLFANGNYKTVLPLLPRLICDRQTFQGSRLHMFVSTTANMTSFTAETGLHPHTVVRTPPTDSVRAFSPMLLKAQLFDPGDVVLIETGVLGRLLVVEWVKMRPQTTFLELGSFFDPQLGFRKLAYHRGGWAPGCANYLDQRVKGFEVMERCFDRIFSGTADAFERPPLSRGSCQTTR